MPTSNQSHFDVIIIGAGLSGLAAGIRLALYQKNVLILEKHNNIGGLNSFYSIKGRKFDVGLHAITNFAPPQTKGSPLSKLFKQLRIPRSTFDLSPQSFSKSTFPDINLLFSNDINLLISQINDKFPHQIDAFLKLNTIVEHDFSQPLPTHLTLSTKQHLPSIISDPQLRELLLLPILYYGSAQPNDVNWAQFCVLYKSIYLEGFARPYEGIRLILRTLKEKFHELGGKRLMKAPVASIVTEGKKTKGVILENGQFISANYVLSSAGLPETLRLCQDQSPTAAQNNIGTFSFAETTLVFPQQPKDLNWLETIIFFSNTSTLNFEAPQNLIDLRSGVICIPNNYQYQDTQLLPEGILKTTVLANYHHWAALSPDEYLAKKTELLPQIQAAALKHLPHLPNENAWKASHLTSDMFTPTTIKRFTNHIDGTIYGAPNKRPNGQTHLENLFIIGTDQGYLGITGSMISGITIANQHILSPTPY